jgi:hypothetical protein
MNQSCEQRSHSGINILRPITDNQHYQEALEEAKTWWSPNNISPIITYAVGNSCNILWMGDIEKDFLEKIKDEVWFKKFNILFAPHHWRVSWKIPKDILDIIQPDIVIIWEAPAEDLDYYNWYNTITQNSAGNITLDCWDKRIDIFVSNNEYPAPFLKKEEILKSKSWYLWTLYL